MSNEQRKENSEKRKMRRERLKKKRARRNLLEFSPLMTSSVARLALLPITQINYQRAK
jgi:hypothetical protein